MKKGLVFSLLFIFSLLGYFASADDVTYCVPSTAECVRIDNYVGSTKVSTSIYYGTKTSAPKGPIA